MSSSVISQAQFGKRAPNRAKDPSGDPKFNKPRFGGHTIGNVPSRSRTMHIAKGHVPHAPETHPHHRKSGKRSRRAR